MTNEEMHRAMEFIIEQQAQYAARIDRDEAQDTARFEKDESRLARLEEYFQMLVELARGTDERLDTMGKTLATLSHTMNELVQRAIIDESRRAGLEESFTLLVELARRADERLDQDAGRFERDESRLASLEDSFKMLVDLAHRHG